MKIQAKNRGKLIDPKPARKPDIHSHLLVNPPPPLIEGYDKRSRYAATP